MKIGTDCIYREFMESCWTEQFCKVNPVCHPWVKCGFNEAMVLSIRSMKVTPLQTLRFIADTLQN